VIRDLDCGRLGGFWIIVMLLLALVVGLGAIAMALARSRFAKRWAVATIVLALLVPVTSVLVALDVLPYGGSISELRESYAREQERRGVSRAQQEKEREEWTSRDLKECTETSGKWALLPLALGGIAFGFVYALGRVTSSR
jgi:hypothetical protein